tara:strand:+ start:318 stop:506 length:189 start_codon:yes stop_codon:yes gene_type:complete
MNFFKNKKKCPIKPNKKATPLRIIMAPNNKAMAEGKKPRIVNHRILEITISKLDPLIIHCGV